MNKTLEYFKIISSIPHESKNEGALADYLVNFAKEHNLSVFKDNFNNVLIKKVSKRKPVILHSHLDMVCVKDRNMEFDFSTMPIKLVEENNYLSSYKTSLGADNGIGVATILSLLEEDKDFNIEAFFTTDEEVAMTGATNFDYSLLSGKKLISLDGFSSKQIIVGCASISDSIINFVPKFNKTNKQGYGLIVNGLKGGHSGDDINKNVGNAINIVTEILSSLNDVELSTMQGGKQFNYIPNFVTVSFYASNFEEKISEIIDKYKKEHENIKIEYVKTSLTKTLSKDDSKKLLNILKQIKTGVISGNVDSIELSQNLASIDLDNGIIKISNRAHNENRENEQIAFLKNLAEENNFSYKIFDRQSGLIQNKNSILTQELCKANKEVNKEDFEVVTKHISIEGAIFKQKKEDLEIAVVSPDIYDVHSTKERVYLPSLSKNYNLLINFLNMQ